MKIKNLKHSQINKKADIEIFFTNFDRLTIVDVSQPKKKNKKKTVDLYKIAMLLNFKFLIIIYEKYL